MTPEPDPPEPDQSLLEEIERQRRLVEEEAEKAAWEEYDKARQERPEWYTLKDMLNPILATPPQGFLAKDEILRRKTVNVLFGPGGSYKTWFTTFMMGRLALGLPIFKIPTRKCKTLLLSEEMDENSVGARLRKMFSLEDSEKILDSMAFRFQMNFDFYARPEVAKKRLIRCIEESNSPDIVFIDALIDIHTGDENSNRDMGIVFGIIKDVAISTNTCIVIIHHAGKASEFRKGTDRARGASAMQNKCADMILIDPMAPGPSGLPRSRFSIEKHRDLSMVIEPFAFSLEKPQDGSDGVVVVFDGAGADTASEANVAKIRDAVEDLAGGDEVSRETLRIRMVDGEKWSKRRFEETLGYAARVGVIKRRKDGRDAWFSV